MSAKRPKVSVKITKVEDAQIQVAGRDAISGNREGRPATAADGGSADLDMEVSEVQRAQINVVGRDVITRQSADNTLQALEELLTKRIKDGNQAAEVRKLIGEVREENERPAEERNLDKLRSFLESIGKYVAIAGLAATDIEKAKGLLEQVGKFLGL